MINQGLNTSCSSIRIKNAISLIRSKTSMSPRIGVILGSGLGDLASNVVDATSVYYHEIPEYPVSTVKGHEGVFVIGLYNNTPIVALRGRLHFYEGYTPQEITMSVRIMRELGVETLIITNACGGINLSFSPGDFILISDHINYTGVNPLIGPNLEEYGPRFPDVSDIYTKSLRTQLSKTALAEGISTKEGVYIGYSGPNYETAAEIRFFRDIGADIVGMSTVHEALVASHCGMKIIGISCVTNMATGVLDKKLSHDEVVEIANKVKPEFTKLMDIAIRVADQ